MKTNRFMPSQEAQDDASAPENAVTILVGALASAGLGYWGGMQLVELQDGPEALPLIFALLGPVLFVCAIYSYAQILTVGDIKAEAIEAIEVANANIENANAIAGKANAYESLALEVQSLTDKVRSLEAEKRTLEADFQSASNRLVDSGESLEREKANAKKAMESYQEMAIEKEEQTLLLHEKALQIAKNDALAWQMKYNQLSREVARANAEKELASLERSLTTRKSAMTGRTWSAEITAKHEAEEARVAELKALLA